MRILKAVFAALFLAAAVLGGLVVTALVALGGVLVYLGLRLFGRTSPPRPAAPGPAQGRAPAANLGDVIDVSATEVPAERVKDGTE